MGVSYGMRVAKHAIEGLFQVFKFIFWDNCRISSFVKPASTSSATRIKSFKNGGQAVHFCFAAQSIHFPLTTAKIEFTKPGLSFIGESTRLARFGDAYYMPIAL